jgi:condensin complex subunit 3
LIENDSNPEVRRAVLSCIAPSAKTLPKIVERTKDVKENVRKLAYQVKSVIPYIGILFKDMLFS